MRRWKVTLRIVAVAITACLLCFTLAEAKKPDNPGGGGGPDKGPSYQIIKLDTNDNGETLVGSAFDINDLLLDNSRLIVGGVNDSSGEAIRARAAFWTVAELEDGSFASKLNFLDAAGFFHTGAYGCNEWGEIVGAADNALAAVYWSDTNSALEELPAPLAFRYAEAINNSGVICGSSASSFNAVDEIRALVWSFTGDEWKYLELAPQGDPGEDEDGNTFPNQAFAAAVSDEDADTGVITIAGHSNGNAVTWTVILDGSGGLLAGPATILDPGAEARGVNNEGMVCGSGHTGPSSGGDGVVWIDGGPAELLALDDSKIWNSPRNVFPYDVNDNGVIVGYNGFQAVIWPSQDASLIVLDDFLPPRRKSPFFSLVLARAVSESNEIVGAGGTEEGLTQPFLAIPK